MALGGGVPAAQTQGPEFGSPAAPSKLDMVAQICNPSGGGNRVRDRRITGAQVSKAG